MEQTVSERPLYQEQHISQLHTQPNGTVSSNGAHLERDPEERWCPRRISGDQLRHDKVQMPLCRDNLRGNCTRGAFCRFLHSESDEHDRSRFCQNEPEKLGDVSTVGNSQLYRTNEEAGSTAKFSSRGRRSPCRRFQSGRCYRGVSCPYLHPEMPSFHNSRVEQQQVDRAVRDPGFDGRNRDNFGRISLEHVEANKENNSTIMSFSRECRSRSPCQHFLRGKCDFGASCKRWHPVNTYASSRHDLNTQHQGITETFNYPGSGERSRDVTLRTSQEHDRENMHNLLRTGAFSRESREKSPCRNYLRGRCYRGSSCLHLHPVTVYDRPRSDSWSAEQRQVVSGTSRSPHFVDGSIATNFRISQSHDHNNYVNQPCRDTHAFCEQNKAWLTKDGVQLAGSREEMDVNARSSSYERQRNRLAGNFGCDKPIREVCLQFTKGRCTRGELCRYLHGFHEYATSTYNWNEKPNAEAARDSGYFGVANQYANTTTAQDPAGFKNYQSSLGESSLKASDGWFDMRRVDGLSCEVSGEKNRSFCNSAKGHENVSLWSRPFKRQRSRSRSPINLQDDFHSRKFSRCDSRIDLYGGRSRNVAQFQYPDRRSYRYEKPVYHVNGQQRTCEETSVNPRSCEHYDSKLITPQMHEKVVTQGLQLEQHANGGVGSNTVIVGMKNEADTVKCALQPSHTNQNEEILAADSVAVDSSEGAAATPASSQDALELGSTYSGGKHLISPSASDRTILVHEANAEAPIDSGQEGKDETVELTPSIKTYCRKKSKKRQPISCEEPTREEVIDASKQGVEFCSVVDTSLSKPNIVNVSSIPVDMEMSATRNNGLENVLMHDHPVKKKFRIRRKKKGPDASCEETRKGEVCNDLKLDTPVCSLEKTSLSNPDIVSVSDIPADVKMSASNNNDLQNVLMDEDPVIKQVKKKNKKKQAKKNKRKRSEMETSASCEEPMKEEAADSSKQGIQISSLLDTSLSDANTLSLSGVPVEMETSASKNNDLEDVLMRDQPVQKKVKKKRKKKRPAASCEETMEVEVTDVSKLGTPICSVVETSISNPNIVSVSGDPVDLKLSTSNNNDLENVLIDGQLKKKVKKKKKKRSKSATIEEPLEGDVADSSTQVMPISSLVETSLSIPNIMSGSGVPVDKISASKNNHLENVPMCDNPVKQQALPLSLKGVVPNSRRKLLVLDVNGILVDIVVGYSHRYKPDTRVATKAVFKRPFCDEFLQFCFDRFDVGIWSSRTRQNLKKVVDFLLEDSKDRLRFCWDQSHCTATEYKTLENREKPLVLKELKYLWWDTKGSRLPWDAGYYNETNTVLLDDSPYKALRNPVAQYSHISASIQLQECW
ncbi:uncharacterized protein LOC110722205 isoform X2 [Chenopodium quinoa]|uniref:uncharacterized protein LOC110722205 isoform X2 n=1 Tax=Chenopodium quinoa TaxID=63459 RepID=UPI000B77C427|nr:uncharacterized protein LOC110722205 isoform X2 [Chenopodium quinoa]